MPDNPQAAHHLIRFAISVDTTIGLEQRSADASRKGACEGPLKEDGSRAPIEEKRQANTSRAPAV